MASIPDFRHHFKRTYKMKKTITTSNGKQQAVKFRKRQEEAVTGDIVNSIYSYWLESGASRGAPLF